MIQLKLFFWVIIFSISFMLFLNCIEALICLLFCVDVDDRDRKEVK